MNTANTSKGHTNENRNEISFEGLESRQLYSAGGLDPSFGVHGSEVNALGFKSVAIAVQSDNKTVIIGQTHENFAVGRLNANGTVDTSFGTNGKTETNFGSGTISTAEKVLVQSDGRIVVIGLSSALSNSNSEWLVARYNANGSLDTTFGNGGEENVLGTSAESRQVEAIAQQANGKIVFAADFYNGDDFGTAVVRLQTNGKLDTTFGDAASNGAFKGYAAVGEDSKGFLVNAMLIQPDGKILLGGDRFASIPGNFNAENEASLFRLTAFGNADTTFGNGGLVQTYQVNPSEISAITFDKQTNQIVAAGTVDHIVGSNFSDLVTVLRYSAATGAFDTNFGDGGVETKPTGGANNFYATAVTMPTPYTILVVGTSYSNQFIPVEMQFTSTGKADTTFHAPASMPITDGFQTAITHDGRIVISDGSQFERIDEAAPTVSIEKLTDGTESASNGSVRFILDEVYNFDVTVDFKVGGTATPNVDYTGPLAISAAKNKAAGLPTTIGHTTVFAGTGQITLPVNVINDSISEGTETVIVSLQADAAQTYFVGGPSTATVNIFDAITAHAFSKKLIA